MKKTLLIALLAIFTFHVSMAQDEETRSLSSFSKVTVHEGINVFLQKGSEEKARVIARNVDLEDVLTEVSGSRLKVHLDGNSYKSVDVDVYVTYVSLSALGASSAGSIDAEGTIEANGDFDVDVSSAGEIKASIKAYELEIDASSAGDAELEVEVNSIDAEVSSSGDIEISGTAIEQDISASSSGDYDGYELSSEEVDASASSGGSIKVNVSNKLNGRASSGGSVRYKGNPKYTDANSSSGGTVRKS